MFVCNRLSKTVTRKRRMKMKKMGNRKTMTMMMKMRKSQMRKKKRRKILKMNHHLPQRRSHRYVNRKAIVRWLSFMYHLRLKQLFLSRKQIRYVLITFSCCILTVLLTAEIYWRQGSQETRKGIGVALVMLCIVVLCSHLQSI